MARSTRPEPVSVSPETSGPPAPAARLRRALLVGALVVACAALIAYARLRLRTAIVSTHFAYAPIVLASLWWGRRAVWLAALLGVWTIVLGRLAPIGEHAGADTARMACFLLVAFAVGAVKDRADAARREEERSRKELEDAREELFHAERLAAMGRLAAGIAHELNNPLGSVLLYAHVLQGKMSDTDPLREDMDVIVRETLRCREAVRGLLNFGRKSRVRRAPADVAELVRAAVAAAAPKAEEKRVSIKVRTTHDLPRVLLDAAQVRQALVNLIDNALDAVSEGGEVEVRARHEVTENALEIQVADNGRGIAEENMAKLFTPFFTTKEMGRGMGLGLAVAHGVVELHGGRISATSARGRGSVFTMRLPAEIAADDTTGRPAAVPGGRGIT